MQGQCEREGIQVSLGWGLGPGGSRKGLWLYDFSRERCVSQQLLRGPYQVKRSEGYGAGGTGTESRGGEGVKSGTPGLQLWGGRQERCLIWIVSRVLVWESGSQR